MRDTVHSLLPGTDVLIMSAAVADFRPASAATHKIKKDSVESKDDQQQADRGDLSIRLVKNPDILGELAEAHNRHNGQGDLGGSGQRLIRVGFAAETNDIIAYARRKLIQKQLDLLVANDVSRSDSGFGSDTNKVFLFHARGMMEDLPVMPKTGVATAIWDRVVLLLHTPSGVESL
jgi:phosphopantothenoylcysteine decarboxylase/phosphopantothenate--cysteine ligase